MLKQIKKKIRKLYYIVLKKYMKFIYDDKKLQNKVVFTSFNGKSYSDNPKAISEALHLLDDKIELVWLFNDAKFKRKEVPNYVKIVKKNRKNILKELTSAKVWVDNFCKEKWIYKSKKQFYIQTWHGDRAIKRILYDSEHVLTQEMLEEKSCDLAIAGSKFGEELYKTAFHYYGDILCEGSPRNDKLLNITEKEIKKIKEKLSIKNEYKILLFAPTLRRKNSNSHTNQNVGDLKIEKVLQTLEQTTGYKWIALIRAHAAVAGLTGIETSDQIIDVTNYEDMSDLLYITDLLITDYSSSATDFQLTRRPMILYQSDRDEYLKYDRTFYFDLDKSPFIIAKSMNELIEIIKNFNNVNFKEASEKLDEFYGTCESGKAAEKIAKIIINKIYG
ncbi:MAG: hypothetical protein E7310_01900 [Clostridiales bacterium]|nr:hypothetical protein [Clostridiales bacterium]